eukprot:3234978-Prymnesium_polylepis.2
MAHHTGSSSRFQRHWTCRGGSESIEAAPRHSIRPYRRGRVSNLVRPRAAGTCRRSTDCTPRLPPTTWMILSCSRGTTLRRRPDASLGCSRTHPTPARICPSDTQHRRSSQCLLVRERCACGPPEGQWRGPGRTSLRSVG